MNRIRLFMMILAGSWFAAAPAETVADALPASLRTCMSEQEDSRRLSCYDRETARLAQRADAAQAQPAASAPAAPAPVATAAPAASEEKFGYRGSIARAELDRQQADEEKFEQLTATISEISTRPHGELVVTLNNGQIWAQKAPDRSIRLKVGDEITIRRASLGSFMLRTATDRSTRVTRLQ